MATTANGHFAAFVNSGHVYIQDLEAPISDPRRLPLPEHSQHGTRVLSLSIRQCHLLAVSSISQILVFDIASNGLQRTLPGTGRTITALGWCLTSNLLVSGTIDGNVAVWDLDTPGSPIAQYQLRGACQSIECSPTQHDCFAAVHDGRVVIWTLNSKVLRPILFLPLASGETVSISWHPHDDDKLLAATRDDRVIVQDVSVVLESTTSTATAQNGDSSDSEDGFFGTLDDVDPIDRSSLQITQAGLSQIKWLGTTGIVCLSDHGKRVNIQAYDKTTQTTRELFGTQLEHSALSVHIQSRSHGVRLVALSAHGIEVVAVPQTAVDEVALPPTQWAVEKSMAQVVKDVELPGKPSTDPRGMRPVSVSTLREMNSSFARTSKQLRQRKPFERMRQKDVEQAAVTNQEEPVPVSMTSSLELPKEQDEEGSPMPFLSPTIPARKVSPMDLSALEDSIRLPPLPRASFDSSTHSAATQESDDSDDETFVDGMQGSTTFLPGGINVPLPKACAASFTPTGELLTFFPPKPKLAAGRGDEREEKTDDSRNTARKVAKLFPAFGNLAGEPQHWDDYDDDSGFESTSSASADVVQPGRNPSFSFYPSSFPSQQSWKARFSPTKHSFTEQSPQKVIVSRHDIVDVESLLPQSRQLASKYRLFCDEGETAAALCEYNALAAKSVALQDVCDVWRLVALLMEDEVPLELMAGVSSGDDVLVVARQATELVQRQSQQTLSKRYGQYSSQMHWTDNPLGAAWLVRAIFDWAEARADTQILAVLSAVLLCTKDQSSTDNFHGHHALATSTAASYGHDYFTASTNPSQTRSLASQPLPVLRTSSISTENAVYESPLKPSQSPAASSRNASQPSTPHLDSASDTPPLSLPSLGRQSSRLSASASGSVSPEQHRHSFSAAAKYYAQSITDKFASYGTYGTSPPARKNRMSPGNTHELSTSFPSGSWGKSVSFASTTSTTKGSLLSSSLDATDEDEGYDSDKTVEDLSLPSTPKDSDECVVTLKNQNLFDDDVTPGGRQASLLPEDLLGKCRIWCEYYVEQLRCWDLLVQATELEKVSAASTLRSLAQDAAQGEVLGIVPAPAPHGSKACSICEVRMTGVQFFCPECLHSSHLDCLDDFIVTLCVDDGEAFACPTGCGCQCANLPFEVAEVVKEEKPKKKASFTDPRRWRARVEGDSW